ncbi:MAG: HAD-IIA family hydrolase [Acidimicrobiia bacterium]
MTDLRAGAGPGAAGHLVCCDLDGVVWRGETPIQGSAGAIEQLRVAGWRVVFTTNNSSLRIVDYVQRLARVGVPADPDDVCTSAQAAAAVVCTGLTPGAAVLAYAGPGVVEALEARGLRVVSRGPVDAVVVGFHRDFDFDGLTRAADAARGGARFVATNLDPTYPIDGGVIPGAGALVAAVSTAAGRQPEVAGKPAMAMAELVRSRYGNAGIVVGDRPTTDGAFAAALGWPFALVLSGVAGSAGGEPVPDPPPPFVAADLARLVPLVLAAG